MRKIIYKNLIKYAAIPFILLMVLDYFDVPSFIGVQIKNFNPNLFDALFNAVIVIGLYVISFLYIDKRQIVKDDNAKQTANILIHHTYKQCLDNLGLVNDQQVLEKYIVPKIDFNKTLIDSRIEMNLRDNPFVDHAHILELATAGAIDKDQLITYLDIMEKYKSYVSSRITFFDIDTAAKTKEQLEMKELVSQKREQIYQLLKGEVEVLEKLIGGK